MFYAYWLSLSLVTLMCKLYSLVCLFSLLRYGTTRNQECAVNVSLFIQFIWFARSKVSLYEMLSCFEKLDCLNQSGMRADLGIVSDGSPERHQQSR